MYRPILVLKTQKHPCVIESFRYENGDAYGFSCGMYELGIDGYQRSGSISNFDQKGLFLSELRLSSGVLDMKYNYSHSNLIVGSSDSSVGLFDFVENELTPNCLTNVDPSNGLILSVARSNHGMERSDDLIVMCSTQSSSLHQFELPTGLVPIASVNEAHKLHGYPVPAWTVSMNPHSSYLLASGGDDNLLKWWDLRDFTSAVAVSTGHAAGVTAIAWHPHREHVVATGSYDECVHLWDCRQPNKSLATIQTGKIC